MSEGNLDLIENLFSLVYNILFEDRKMKFYFCELLFKQKIIL
jgi:hypothetical protein